MPVGIRWHGMRAALLARHCPPCLPTMPARLHCLADAPAPRGATPGSVRSVRSACTCVEWFALRVRVRGQGVCGCAEWALSPPHAPPRSTLSCAPCMPAAPAGGIEHDSAHVHRQGAHTQVRVGVLAHGAAAAAAAAQGPPQRLVSTFLSCAAHPLRQFWRHAWCTPAPCMGRR